VPVDPFSKMVQLRNTGIYLEVIERGFVADAEADDRPVPAEGCTQTFP
jgi:hypothetical protein